MYRYDEFDTAIVSHRVAEFRDQVARRLTGELTEEQFRPLRLMNGVYLQLHAYMLRIAIPYGVLSSNQLRTLAHIARTYDKGYGHFTTRQNIQFNWPRLVDIPEILEELALVEMHAIQTSGNCIRNVTADPFAGAAADEFEDPRPYAEIIRQWSTLHPEFSFLPRKFKLAITGAAQDRAAIRFHDIGLGLVRNDSGETGFQVYVGGGLGRTPVVGKLLRPFLARQDLLGYLEAILRVYNRHGRRDNKYKARIKILVDALGIDAFREQVEAEWREVRGGSLDLPADEIRRIEAYFAPPAYRALPDISPALEAARQGEPGFGRWVNNNVTAHKQAGYAVVTVSLKPVGGIPGDASAEQMDAVADLADRFSFGEVRVTHEQNLVLAHVPKDDLHALWRDLEGIGLGTSNIGHMGDIIACPGLDYCALANARSIPVAQEISKRFADQRRVHGIGELTLNISGCINACAHHHAAHIGILGVDKRGSEAYQITLGGSADNDAAIGKLVGPAFPADEIANAVETIIVTYLGIRQADEPFIDAYRRVGPAPFKEALYAAD